MTTTSCRLCDYVVTMPSPILGPCPCVRTCMQVVGRQLVGVYLSVWARTSLLQSGAVRGATVTSVSTGFGGYIGNKGAPSCWAHHACMHTVVHPRQSERAMRGVVVMANALQSRCSPAPPPHSHNG